MSYPCPTMETQARRRIPKYPSDEPCSDEVGVREAVTLYAEGKTKIACRICRWWLVEVTTYGDLGNRRFVHVFPALPDADSDD